MKVYLVYEHFSNDYDTYEGCGNVVCVCATHVLAEHECLKREAETGGETRGIGYSYFWEEHEVQE